MQFAIFLAVLLAFVPSGDASHTKLKHLDKMELLKEILTRYFFVKGKLFIVCAVPDSKHQNSLILQF